MTLRVLLVDDEPSFLRITKLYLEEHSEDFLCDTCGSVSGSVSSWMVKTGGHAGCGSSASARGRSSADRRAASDQVVIGTDGVQLRREVLVTSIDQVDAVDL